MRPPVVRPREPCKVGARQGREPEVPFAATDPRWRHEAFTELDMGPALRDAGYGQLAGSVPRPPTTAVRRLLARAVFAPVAR